MLDRALGQAEDRVDHLGRDGGASSLVVLGDFLLESGVKFRGLVGHRKRLPTLVAAREAVISTIIDRAIPATGKFVFTTVSVVLAAAVISGIAVRRRRGIGVITGILVIATVLGLAFRRTGLFVLVGLGRLVVALAVVLGLCGADDHRLQQPVVGVVDAGRGVGVQGVQRGDPQPVGAGEVGVDVGDQAGGLVPTGITTGGEVVGLDLLRAVLVDRVLVALEVALRDQVGVGGVVGLVEVLERGVAVLGQLVGVGQLPVLLHRVV